MPAARDGGCGLAITRRTTRREIDIDRQKSVRVRRAPGTGMLTAITSRRRVSWLRR
ncbi:hypothetical protein BURMUCF1_A0122 [Burkholderia multivorans ATCC BAA-247]|nr:hypothetical protein BURMUCF1_A0122 [Burkholderia multivorans ATCC BAA-247]